MRPIPILGIIVSPDFMIKSHHPVCMDISPKMTKPNKNRQSRPNAKQAKPAHFAAAPVNLAEPVSGKSFRVTLRNPSPKERNAPVSKNATMRFEMLMMPNIVLTRAGVA